METDTKIVLGIVAIIVAATLGGYAYNANKNSVIHETLRKTAEPVKLLCIYEATSDLAKIQCLK